MIIFNAKAFIVGLGSLLIALFFGWITGSSEIGMITFGIVALILSVLMSRPYTGYLKMPHVFFIPTHVFAVVIIVLGISAQIKECKKTPAQKAAESQAESAKDNAEALIKADMKKTATAHYTGDTACAWRMDTFLRAQMIRQMQPERFSYLIKYSSDSTRMLVLVRMGDLKSMRQDIRQSELIKLAHYVAISDDFADRDLYLGMMGESKMFMTHTPTATHISTFTRGENELVGFYDTTAVVKKSSL